MNRNAWCRLRKTPLGVLLAALLLVLSAPAQPAAAQSEPSDQEKAMHYSLYYENFKNENYEGALPDLRWILENAPTYPRNDERNFRRAWEAYGALAQNAEDDQMQQAYIDSAMAIFENGLSRLQDVGADVDEYEWHLERGRFIQTYSNLIENAQPQFVAAYRQAFELGPERIQPYFINAVVRGYLDQGERQQAIDFLDQVEQQRGDEEVASLINEWRGQLFTSPQERYQFIASQVEQDAQNPELLHEKFELEQQLGKREQMYQTAKQLLSVAPTAQSYMEVGQLYLDDGQPREAVTHFQQALDAEGSQNLARDLYFNMGVAQRQMENLQQARSYFRQALQADESFGQAYLAIGDLYATAVAQCSSEMGREDQAVYWLVTDYYQRAKSADPSIARQADQKIQTYQRYYPDREALFFNKWNEGDSFSIDYGCYAWIGETTTVKTPS